jgi:hypothetical protein
MHIQHDQVWIFLLRDLHGILPVYATTTTPASASKSNQVSNIRPSSAINILVMLVIRLFFLLAM